MNGILFSRGDCRRFRGSVVFTLVCILAFSSIFLAAEPADMQAIVGESDLVYDQPAARPVDGHPIGNGVMGTMVWTTPETLEFQINRVDVFAVNRNHRGPQYGPADYCNGCARITVDVGGKAFAPGDDFRQHLSLHDAEERVAGDSVRARCFASAVRDVLAVEIEDRREEPRPLRVDVSMWRDPEVKNGRHTARYDFQTQPESVVLSQGFTEADYYDGSVVAVRARGGEVHEASDRCRSILLPARKGKRLILISSAASWNPDEDLIQAALETLNDCAEQTYEQLRKPHAAWWSDFWARTYIRLTSEDGRAERIEHLYNLNLYYMASSSRGELPPKWNASIFAVDGDARDRGAQYWVWTTEISYFSLLAADAIDLTDPYFNMYVGMLPACRTAARQRWGARGAYYPETVAFDGPTVLPDDIAQEFQDVILGRKPDTEFSDDARGWGRYCGQLFTLSKPRPPETTPEWARSYAGRYTWISHIASSGSELAVQAWWRYRYTGDRDWLRTHAYPLLRETTEFYRSIAKKGDDGCYHLEGLNQHEAYWGANDGIIDLAAIRGTTPLAIRAAEILDVDEPLRAKWREFLDHLAPYPIGDDPEALPGGNVAPDVWAVGRKGPGSRDAVGPAAAECLLWPVFPFEDWTLETPNPEMTRIAQKVGELNAFRSAILNKDYSFAGSAIRTPIHGARLGRGDELPDILTNYYQAYHPFPNSFSMFEGPTNQSIEHLGSISMALNESLLQSVASRPGEPEIISVFPAWPSEWDAEFKLLARGGFLVSSSIRDGVIKSVQIESRRGEECRVRSPWPVPCQVATIDGEVCKKAIWADGVLRFPTSAGTAYRLSAENQSSEKGD